MKVAVLSGKGGAGKTLVAVNLAAASKSIYLDCDVEEPNGHLFFKPEIESSLEVSVPLPVVNKDLCDGCRICVDFCKFNALAYINETVLVFNEVCHSCGGCTMLCPVDAISEMDKRVGVIDIGYSNGVKVYSGKMDIGEASGVPIIDKLIESVNKEVEDVIIDCPPGSACVVMESIKDADYCLLVAEPTLFGVHNVAMVDELARKFNKKVGVVINKSFSENNPADQYCRENNLSVVGRIPFKEEIGSLNAEGKIVVEEKVTYKEDFLKIWELIKEEAVL